MIKNLKYRRGLGKLLRDLSYFAITESLYNFCDSGPYSRHDGEQLLRFIVNAYNKIKLLSQFG